MTTPGGPAYDLLLVAHVTTAVVGFGSVGLTGVEAWRARLGPGGPGAGPAQRFFRPGPDLVGRTLYAVPVLGLVLLGLSHGTYRPGDPFVVVGLMLWVCGVGLAEGVVWPGGRRIAEAFVEVAASRSSPTTGEPGPVEWPVAVCRRVALAAAGMAGIFWGATVVMFLKP